MRNILFLVSLMALVASSHAQDESAPEPRPHFDPPSTDDPFLVDGRSNVYQWPEGRFWLQDAPNDEERWRRLEVYLGGMQGPMFEIGQRWVVFYDALRDENYGLAVDTWSAIARVFVNAVTIRPQYKPAADAMFLRTQWHQMRAALRSGDRDRIWEEFAYTKAVCESCHQATNMEWANDQKVFQYTLYPFDGGAAEVAAGSFAPVELELDAETVFRPCTGCHTVGEGEPNLVGPNLHGMFGREFGALEGYNYSEALRESNLRVTDETLDRWLTDSAQLVPGNNMIFPALRTQQERDMVIAYMRQVTQ